MIDEYRRRSDKGNHKHSATLEGMPLLSDGEHHEDDEWGFDESDRIAFSRGWNAHAATMPDREALLRSIGGSLGCNRRAHYGNVEHPFCGEHGGLGQWPCHVSSGATDAVLALLNKEGD